MAKFVQVAFDLPLRQYWTYLNPEPDTTLFGKRLSVSFGARKLTAFCIKDSDTSDTDLDDDKLKSIQRVIDKEALFNADQLAAAEWMSSYYLCGPGEALAAMLPSGRREKTAPSLLQEETDISTTELDLSEEQKTALSAIIDDNANHNFYLWGITGSGKTEVFLRAADHILNQGKSVLYLVPEISLTHQVIEAIAERFGALAATLHSGMTASQKLSEWRRIQSGEARIVVGPRSAIFAPLKDPALYIIDEEQDGSYKNGTTPRYHARQMAMWLSSRNGAKVLMGSATPSVEAWKLMQDGVIKRMDLGARLAGGAPAQIEIVDIRNEKSCISKRLKEAILETWKQKRQTILFLNRRGFSWFYNCPSCGYQLKCKQCSVSLTYHKKENRAVCHYCGYSASPPTSCPSCGSFEATFTGFGTQQVEEEVKKLFPELSVQRIDTDSVEDAQSLKETLNNFKNGQIDILLGTQMVAKGLNFPGVQLVGVIMADSALNMPDFRAAERTFSLVVQVAGRAGRYFPDGKVLVQTLRPSEPAIQLACAANTLGFYEQELQFRKEAGFPPYNRLIRIVARSKIPERANEVLEYLCKHLETLLGPNAELLGPSECPLSMVSGNSRQQILLRGKNMKDIHTPLRRALDQLDRQKLRNVYLELDVDPIHLL